MIKKDKYGITVQHDPNRDTYGDGGDSARSEGILSLTGDPESLSVIPKFENNGICVRHPFQSENNNNNPNNFTRDQLLCLMSGYAQYKMFNTITKRIFKAHAKRLFFGQNSHDQENNKKVWYKSLDPMHPGQIGFMIQAAKMYYLYPLLVFCWPFLILEILIHSLVTPKRETNQLLSMLLISGYPFLLLYVILNPKWRENINTYWGTYPFRDQQEIANKFISHIERKLK